jgi:hypothetical protein
LALLPVKLFASPWAPARSDPAEDKGITGVLGTAQEPRKGEQMDHIHNSQHDFCLFFLVLSLVKYSPGTKLPVMDPTAPGAVSVNIHKREKPESCFKNGFHCGSIDSFCCQFLLASCNPAPDAIQVVQTPSTQLHFFNIGTSLCRLGLFLEL